MRFDILTANTLNISRSKASELIKNGKILLNDKAISKPGFEVGDNDKICLIDEIYVGRGALKLKSFLSKFSLNVSGKTALDVGASTGGFVQILLQNGAKSVVALDVGNSQLDSSLKCDSRVCVLENTDLRAWQSDDKFDIVTCDVSFISVILLLPYINAHARSDILILFKPQFEVGASAKRNKKGVVTDLKAVNMARSKFEIAATSFGWILQSAQECEIKGKEGNAEFFYAFKKIRY
ncbi:MAG: 23S rRNA (cytidine-2'-O)-methyltransferase TlyA [Campylobacter sp.]